MKYVVVGEPSGMSREAIMQIYPRHKPVVDDLIARGLVIGIGPFDDFGNLAIFRTRDAAEEYLRRDPFILEGVVLHARVREWRDGLLPE